MKYVCCAVLDSAAAVYGTPMFGASVGQLQRSFSDEVNRRPQHGEHNALNGHPEDFALWFIGHYDDVSGVFEDAGSERRCVSRGQDVFRS